MKIQIHPTINSGNPDSNPFGRVALIAETDMEEQHLEVMAKYCNFRSPVKVHDKDNPDWRTRLICDYVPVVDFDADVEATPSGARRQVEGDARRRPMPGDRRSQRCGSHQGTRPARLIPNQHPQGEPHNESHLHPDAHHAHR